MQCQSPKDWTGRCTAGLRDAREDCAHRQTEPMFVNTSLIPFKTLCSVKRHFWHPTKLLWACLYAEHIENDNRIKKARGCRALCAMCADQTGPAQSAQASNSPFTDALQRVLPPSFSSPLAFLLFHLLLSYSVLAGSASSCLGFLFFHREFPLIFSFYVHLFNHVSYAPWNHDTFWEYL